MLDTDIVSFALRGVGAAAEQLVRHEARTLCVSAITIAELRFGATRANSSRIHKAVDVFTRTIAVLPFDAGCADEYGRISGELATRGTPIGDFDALIAAHALTLNLTLVTNNVKHFSRVDGLRIENWS